MAQAIDHAVDRLKHLVESLTDAEEGFRTAAGGTGDHGVKQVFETEAEHHARLANELRLAVRELGGEAPVGGSFEGRMYRAWVNVKAALSRDDALAMLEECERGEDYIKGQFREALDDSDLPMQCRTLVERQYQEVLSAHDKVRDLRNARRHV